MGTGKVKNRRGNKKELMQKKEQKIDGNTVINGKKGSFTIELTLLMPLIIFIFLLIIFINYYVHDRVIIDKVCYAASLRSANYPDENERENVALTVLERELSSRLLWSWDYTTDIEVLPQKVTVSFEGNLPVREGLINKYLRNRLFSYSASQTSYVIDEADYIRSQP